MLGGHTYIRILFRVFPSYPSQEDEELYNKMKCLQWITPIQLGIKPSDINESFWKLAIKGTIYIYIYSLQQNR